MKKHLIIRNKAHKIQTTHKKFKQNIPHKPLTALSQSPFDRPLIRLFANKHLTCYTFSAVIHRNLLNNSTMCYHNKSRRQTTTIQPTDRPKYSTKIKNWIIKPEVKKEKFKKFPHCISYRSIYSRRDIGRRIGLALAGVLPKYKKKWKT